MAAFCSITRVFQELSAKDVDPGRRVIYHRLMGANPGRAVSAPWAPGGIVWLVRRREWVADLAGTGISIGVIFTVQDVASLANLVGDEPVQGIQAATAYLSVSAPAR